MADYMHACPACHTFYPPGVAQSVRKGVCACGTPLQVTSLTAADYLKLSHIDAVRRVFGDEAAASLPAASAKPAPAAPAVQHRKNQPPEEFDVDPQQLPSSGCLAYFAILGVPTVAIFAFIQSEFDLRYIFWGLCLSLFLFAVARISAHLANVVRHLGAIRWLMQHGDETEPVPAARAAQSPQPQSVSNTGMWVVAGIMLVIIVFLAIYLGTSPT